MAKTKEFVELQPICQDPKKLNTEETQTWITGDLVDTKVIRSILMAEIKAVRSDALILC